MIGSKSKNRLKSSRLLMSFLVLIAVLTTTSCANNDAEVAVNSRDKNSLAKDLRNFHKVNDYLYRGGMPTPDGIQALHDNGFTTIVDLRNDKLGIAIERHVAVTLGMEHISLPTGNAPPSIDKIARFISTVRKMKKQHEEGREGAIYFHCNAGCDRTSFYLATVRVVDQGWHPVRAYLEMLRYGFLIHHLEFPVTSEADKYLIRKRNYDVKNPQR